MRKFILPLLAAVLFATNAMAGGFLLYEHGAAGTGMASARTAASDDPSAMYYNPAAITELKGFQFEFGTTGILPFTHYEAAGVNNLREYSSNENGVAANKPVNDGMNSVDAKVHGFTPIHLYATYNMESIGVTLGYGLNNPFGLGTYWPGDWDGRFIATEVEIQTFFNQPTVAVDIAKLAGFKDSFKLSVAAGYNFVYGTARLSKKVDLRIAESPIFGALDDPEAEMRMTGSAIGHGWNVALYAELPDVLSFGASVRSGVSLPFSGDAKFVFNKAGLDARAALASASSVAPEAFIPDSTTGNLTIDLPLNMNFGLAYLGIEDLLLEFDFYIAFFESYKELKLEFACAEEGTCAALEGQEPIRKDWTESMQFSIGAQYRVMDSLFVRLGYGLVTSPVPKDTYDPSLPDGTRNLFTVGAGYHGSWWKLDLGYMLAIWGGTKSFENGNTVGVGSGLAGPAIDDNGDFVSPLVGNPEGMAYGDYSTVTHLLALSFTGAF